MIDTTLTLGRLVNDDPTRTRVLERFGLDYCCGGQRSLADACAEAGVGTGEVIAALTAEPAGQQGAWVSMPADELARDIVATHHAFLWEELPRVSALAQKVTTVHGENHTELQEIREVFEMLRAELEPHLTKEERVLFPAIELLVGQEALPQFGFGSIANPVSMMMSEHDAAGDLLTRLRTLTDGYTTPADGCASYRAFFDGMAAVEADTHLHIHKENNTLFPAVVALEQQRADVNG